MNDHWTQLKPFVHNFFREDIGLPRDSGTYRGQPGPPYP